MSMTKEKHRIIAIMLAFVMAIVLCSAFTSTRAYAEEFDDVGSSSNEAGSGDDEPGDRFQSNYAINGTYTTVASMSTSGNGFNRNVTLECSNINVFHHNDVRMLDKYDNVIWEEYGAVGYNGTRTFWCGSNVYKIQVRVALQNILGAVTPLNGNCIVSW